jgi:Holliday junction resolvase
MRLRSRRDANEKAIVEALEAVGFTIARLNEPGAPDLLATRGGRLWLIEIKDGSKSPSRQKLTPKQILWHARWREAPLYTVRSIEEALALGKGAPPMC